LGFLNERLSKEPSQETHKNSSELDGLLQPAASGQSFQQEAVAVGENKTERETEGSATLEEKKKGMGGAQSPKTTETTQKGNKRHIKMQDP